MSSVCRLLAWSTRKRYSGNRQERIQREIEHSRRLFVAASRDDHDTISYLLVSTTPRNINGTLRRTEQRERSFITHTPGACTRSTVAAESCPLQVRLASMSSRDERKLTDPVDMVDLPDTATEEDRLSSKTTTEVDHDSSSYSEENVEYEIDDDPYAEGDDPVAAKPIEPSYKNANAIPFFFVCKKMEHLWQMRYGRSASLFD